MLLLREIKSKAKATMVRTINNPYSALCVSADEAGVYRYVRVRVLLTYFLCVTVEHMYSVYMTV